MNTEYRMPPLKMKQRKFCEFYLECWEGKKAAERAGYSWAEKAASRLLTLPQVQAYLSERMAQAGMPADEVLARLAQQARANAGDFIIVSQEIDPKTGETVQKIGIDWDLVKERGFLIKEISWSRRGEPVIKLHDAQNALIQIGRVHGLFKDINEVTGKNGGPLTWKEFIRQEDGDAEPSASGE